MCLAAYLQSAYVSKDLGFKVRVYGLEDTSGKPEVSPKAFYIMDRYCRDCRDYKVGKEGRRVFKVEIVRLQRRTS